MAVQAGFIGPWGEWHGSTNFDYDVDGRKEVVRALLGAVPDRNVQIRTPQHKKNLYNDCNGGEAIDSGNAFNGSPITRTGHHNDCFLASDTDYGTYTSPANISEYAYLAQETKYTAMGGETCNPYPPRSLCSKAKEELELFHYTYLNSGYHPQVLGNWTSGGCMEEIAARLGYRLVLKTGTFGSRAAPGGIVPYSIEVKNVGYASLVNKRPFQLVLRDNLTNAPCGGVAFEVDMRKWFGGETNVVSGDLVLPADLPVGTYGLFLNLADDSERLRNDARFKVSKSKVFL